MAVSVTVAVLGFLLAYTLYVSKPYLPQKIADSLGTFYNAVLNKYYVDELYAKVFVKPLVDGSTSILWQGVDRKVIDDTPRSASCRTCKPRQCCQPTLAISSDYFRYIPRVSRWARCGLFREQPRAALRCRTRQSHRRADSPANLAIGY